MKLEGGVQLAAKLAALPRKVSGKIVRQPLRKHAKPILADAKANMPVITGQARRSLKVRAGKRRKGYTGVVITTKAGDFKGDEFYIGFVEGGTEERFHKSGKYVGRVEAQHPIERAFDQHKETAAQGIVTDIAAGIEAAARGTL